MCVLKRDDEFSFCHLFLCLPKPPARIYEMKKSDPLSNTPVDFLDVQIKLNRYTEFNESPLKLSSPIFKTVIHDVSLIGGFQQSPPRQEDWRGWYRPNDQVEGLFQLHFTWEQMSSFTYLFTLSTAVWWPRFHLDADLQALPVHCFFTSFVGTGWTAIRYFGSASKDRKSNWW